MPVIVQDTWWTEQQILAQPDRYFVFGDNEQREGSGGQAKHVRGKKNCIGIRTKRKPKTDLDAYWHDSTYVANVAMVMQDFYKVIQLLELGKTVVFPRDGFGTGLAKLSENAPKTLNFIQMMYDYCVKTWPTQPNP